MKVRGVTLAILRHWPVGALALVAALAFGFAGQITNTTQLEAQTATVRLATVTTVIHYADHAPVPCFENPCGAGQVGAFNSVVHDKATVTSSNVTLNPTGSVRFAFFPNLHCTNTPSTTYTAPVSAFAGAGTAESANTGPLAVGSYSYKAVYSPDAAAKALGFISTPANCEQLAIIRVKTETVIHDSNHDPLPCKFNPCGPAKGQTAPFGTDIHDLATVDSGVYDLTPTGYVNFRFFGGSGLNADPECETRAISAENVPVSTAAGVTTAESSEILDLPVGEYSYKATFFPDAAAIARGMTSHSPAPCEQLEITP